MILETRTSGSCKRVGGRRVLTEMSHRMVEEGNEVELVDNGN